MTHLKMHIRVSELRKHPLLLRIIFYLFYHFRSLTNLELIKLEKKRERNRIAATKCRQRKMEKISTLGNEKTSNYSPNFLPVMNLIDKHLMSYLNYFRNGPDKGTTND